MIEFDLIRRISSVYWFEIILWSLVSSNPFAWAPQGSDCNCKGSACGSVACLKHYVFPSVMRGGKALRHAPHGPQMGRPQHPLRKRCISLCFCSLPLQTSPRELRSLLALILGSGRCQNLTAHSSNMQACKITSRMLPQVTAILGVSLAFVVS